MSQVRATARRFQKDFQDQVFDMFDAADMGLTNLASTRADIDAIDRGGAG